MKVWITRDSAGSLLSGGLERVHVWFTKPVWVESKVFEDLPFSGEDAGGYVEQAHWAVVQSGKCQRSPVSFGNVFGYGESNEANLSVLARFVWGQIKDHFHRERLYEWTRLEKEEMSNIKDFFLEIDLDIQMTGIPNIIEHP